jgi:hypothetical protein
MSGQPLADELTPVSRVTHRFLPKVRKVCQFYGEIPKDRPIEDVCIETLKWLQKRSGAPLPQKAWKFKSFDLEPAPGQHTSVVSLEGQSKFWIAKLDHPCRTTPGRTWSTEIATATTNNNTLFGVKLTVVSRDADAPIFKTIPGILRQVIDKTGLYIDGCNVSYYPAMVSSINDVTYLANLIFSTKRRLPIFLISLKRFEENITDAVINVQTLTGNTKGLAHVFVISGDMTFHLSEKLGRDLTVYDGAIRTYYPISDLDNIYPFHHPIIFRKKVLDWDDEFGKGSEGCLGYLTDRAFYHSSRRESSSLIPSFMDVKSTNLRAERDLLRRKIPENKNILEIESLYQQEIDQLREAADMADSTVVLYENERNEAINQMGESQNQLFWLRDECDRLRQRLNDVSNEDTDDSIPIPDDYDALPGWCREHLAGRLVLHQRVVNNLRTACFHDIPLVYKSLLILAKEYRDMRKIGGQDLKYSFEEKLKEYGLDLSVSISEVRAGETGKEYFIKYDGKDRLLKWHLRKGTSREENLCLRIYFFWDDVANEVVVGTLPNHLKNRNT